MRITRPEDLRLLPDGTRLHVPGRDEPVLWLRAYLCPHQDLDSGLWRLPWNPFTEYGATELEARLPEAAGSGPAALRGDEEWLTTLTDPHDTTR